MSKIKTFKGPALSVKVKHDLGTKYNHVTVYVGDYKMEPVGVYPINKNSLTVTFGSPQSDITVVVG